MTEPILTSTQNPRVKQVLRLRRGRHRQADGLCLVEDELVLRRALDAHLPLLTVFACRELLDTDSRRALAHELRERTSDFWWVTLPVYARLLQGAQADGLLAIAQPLPRTLDELPLDTAPLVAVLEGVEKPGNLGAIARTADAAGVSALVLADGRTDCYNPHALRASRGTLFSLPVAAAPADQALAWLRRHRLQLCAARVDADRCYSEIDFTRPTAILFGSEAHGLSPTWQQADVLDIRLPLLGVADSLNVSTTAAVLFYEAWRQRHAPAPTRV